MTDQPTVFIRDKSARPVACGHPWIFSGAIEKTRQLDDDCDRVVVRDSDDRVLGHGFYSPNSQIRVRVYERTDEPELEPMDAGFFQKRLQLARNRRRSMGLPGDQTNGFRLVNSEGDGLPGAVVDRWNDLVVFQLTTHPLVRHRESFVQALVEVFFETPQQAAVLEVPAPESIAEREGFDSQRGWRGNRYPGRVEFVENGVRFCLDTSAFQKTGHYADMRPHRRWLARRMEGKRLLDAFCYTGGFGLAAAAAGAEAVTCVDSSNLALQSTRVNAELNGVHQRVETIESDVEDFLRSAYDRQLRFEAVVLDPPKFAPRKEHVSKALKAYESLAIQAIRLVEPGGLIAVGSCSQPIGADELERVLGHCCGRDGICSDVVYRGTQGPDHPVPAGMPEGRYLSFVAARVR